MEIGQREESGKYKFYVNIDGKQALLLDNNSPQEFKNGQMYVGDPWYDAAGVQLRNIQYNEESFVTPPVQLSPIRNAPRLKCYVFLHFLTIASVYELKKETLSPIRLQIGIQSIESILISNQAELLHPGEVMEMFYTSQRYY